MLILMMDLKRIFKINFLQVEKGKNRGRKIIKGKIKIFKK